MNRSGSRPDYKNRTKYEGASPQGPSYFVQFSWLGNEYRSCAFFQRKNGFLKLNYAEYPQKGET
jgi:hypothetical protein